jgi:hypothetical protein
VAFGLFLALAVYAADVSGKWVGKGALSDYQYGQLIGDFELNLVQTGSSISGTAILNNHKPVTIETGAIKDSEITFSCHLGNSLITARFTQQDKEMQGQITSDQGQVYDVDLKKQ